MEVARTKRDELVEGHYEMAKEVKAFHETKAGVKGLCDFGAVKIPRFFIHAPESLSYSNTSDVKFEMPLINLRSIEGDGARRRKIVDSIHRASETWGFFQMVNHGVPDNLMDSMLKAVRGFHEQPKEAKMGLYSTDSRQNVRFYSNGTFSVSNPAFWKDTLSCSFIDDTLDPEAIPLICRKEMLDYVKCIIKLRETLAELLSEALGLRSDYLEGMECMKGETLTCHYSPACPEPNLTFGASKHSDGPYLTILLQDNLGGLQVLHKNHWVNVTPIQGALIVNMGDLMQVITNDKFKSVEHRVLAQSVGPRISVACFFHPSNKTLFKPIQPIEELLSDNNPPIYREVLFTEYISYYHSKGADGAASRAHFRLG